ncbi:MAG TPA: choice-of-anchor tandem repeat GloVer-containing protein [Rhizomicrobium sp.]|nr:choice-of-anchor tandem repeat GloVer-containing protein [Rhizomicrobium sp.]
MVRHLHARRATRAVLVSLLSIAALPALAKDRLHTLQIFNGPNGGAPETPLLADGHGGFYGATYMGGAANLGTVFHVAADGSVSTIHEFAAGTGAAHPFANLLLQDDGSLIGGALRADGKTGSVVYKLSSSGRENVLHRFTKKSGAGYGQIWGLAKGPDGAIYGTTLNGGPFHCGALFRMTADGKTTAAHVFGGNANNDGCSPTGAPLFDAAGNLYGVTGMGGAGTSGNGGTVYRLAADGSYSLLHSFSTFPAPGDGKTPTGPVARDAHGNLYGATYEGDTSTAQGGVVWRVAKDGSYSVVHAFSGDWTRDGDGASPYGGVIADASGNLYGTTSHGGVGNNGAVFKIARSGRERVLHSFLAIDGAYPVAAPTLDANGDLVGTTTICGIDGGACQQGTVYRLKRS